ncbi:MAG: GIY-YIG nuclease family protein, partial [Clostridia bacterium]
MSELALKLQQLPESPGCYLMRCQGQIIYVGKAVNLKNRVRSYFQSSRTHSPKVSAMVERIDDFDIMLCDTNLEALILECNLIKRHMPYYNILLKDDKHYPYIRIDQVQPYPRVELVRRMANDGAKYFGPYIGATAVREVLDVVRQAFPLRTCAQAIVPDKPRRPCIHYEMGQCLGPCAGHTD